VSIISPHDSCWKRVFLYVFGTLLLCSGTIAYESQSGAAKREDKSMRISIQRTGGFTAIPLTKTVDVAAMPPNEATELQQMVEAADFFNLPSTIPSTPQPDRFVYQISVEQEGKQHSVTVGETAMPPGMKPLVDLLMKSAHQTERPKL
jgi:hypothetical protein